MKLNKMKISRLTATQVKAVRGGYGSTQHNSTCTWCTGGKSPKDGYSELCEK